MKNKTKKLKFSDFKKGEFIKKVGSHIELKIIEVGKDWRSGKKFIKRSVKPIHRFLAWMGCKRLTLIEYILPNSIRRCLTD